MQVPASLMPSQAHGSFGSPIPAIYRHFCDLLARPLTLERCTTSIQGRRPILLSVTCIQHLVLRLKVQMDPTLQHTGGLSAYSLNSPSPELNSMTGGASWIHCLVPLLSNLKRETSLISYTVDLTRQTPCQAKFFLTDCHNSLLFGHGSFCSRDQSDRGRDLMFPSEARKGR
jgi:hypothetical protein